MPSAYLGLQCKVQCMHTSQGAITDFVNCAWPDGRVRDIDTIRKIDRQTEIWDTLGNEATLV